MQPKARTTVQIYKQMVAIKSFPSGKLEIKKV